MSPSRYDLLRIRLRPLKRETLRASRDGSPNPQVAADALRRLQAVMPLLGLSHGTEEKTLARVRKALRRVKRVRDADALDRLISDLQESDHQARQSLSVRRSPAEAKGATAKRFRKKDVGALTAVTRKLEAVANSFPKPETDPEQTNGQLAARARRRATKDAIGAKQSILEAGQVYLADRLGKPRRALRKLRGSLELLRDLEGNVSAADLRTLDRTLQSLDRIRDLQRLITDVRKSQSALTPPDLKSWHDLDNTIITLENRCRRSHARYMRERSALLVLCEQWGAKATPTASRRKVS